jgi:hypothetical protein
MRNYYLQLIFLLSFALILSAKQSQSQQNIYLEDFAGQNDEGLTDGDLGPYNALSGKWIANINTGVGSGPFTGTSDYFKVTAEEFEARDVDYEGVWESQTISLVGYTDVSISVDCAESGDHESSDYIRGYYVLDGGAETLFGEFTDDFNSGTLSVSDLSGSSLKVVVRVLNNAGTEYLRFDNVEVQGVSLGADPTLAITAPSEASTLTSSSTNATFSTTNFTLGNPGSGADGYVQYKINGGTLSDHFSTDPIGLTGLTNGPVELILKLVDDSGVDLVPSVADTVNFTVAIPQPSISITAPLEASTVTESSTILSLDVQNFTVANPGIEDGYIQLSVNGGSFTDMFTADDVLLTGLVNGPQQVIVKLVDNSGVDLTPLTSDTVNFLVAIFDGIVETFANSNATSSYSDGSFTGVNGIDWTYTESRDANGDANGSGIDLPALMLRRVSDNSKVVSSTISGGIGDFSVKLYKGFTGGGNRQVEVFVNGLSVGTSTPFDDFDEHVFTISDIDVTGDFTLEIRNITDQQIIVDDISWTAGSSDPTLSITAPMDGATLTSSETTVEFSIANFSVGTPGTEDGYIVYQLDAETPTDQYTADPINLSGLLNGIHTFTMKLVDPSGVDLTPAVEDQVSFTVDVFDGTIETFANSNATSSYGDGSFMGVNGITWSYFASRDGNGDANGSGINLPALMLRRSSDNSRIVSDDITGGIGNLSMKLYKGFTGSGNRQVEVLVNGQSVGTSTPFDNLDEQVFEIQNIDVGGDFTLEVRNITSSQVIIDDIAWTAGPTDTLLQITSPTEGQIFTSSQATVTYSVMNFDVNSPGNGDGYIQYQLDDDPITNLFTNSPLNFQGLAGGPHTIRMRLVDQNGTVLDPSIGDTVNFTISIPTLAITSPTFEQIIQTNQTDVVFEVENFAIPDQGKVNYRVNGGNWMEQNSTDPISLSELQNGSYLVELELVDTEGASLVDPVTASVLFYVNVPFVYPVNNGDFELWTNDVPDFWTTIESGIDVSQEMDTVFSGQSAARVDVLTGTQDNTDFRQTVDVVAGQKYIVSCRVFHTQGSMAARLFVDGQYLTYSDENILGEWQEITAEYTASGSGQVEVGLRFYDQPGFSGSEVVFVDNFELGPVKSLTTIRYAGTVEYDSSGTWLSLPQDGKLIPVGVYSFRFTEGTNPPFNRIVAVGESPVNLTMVGVKVRNSTGQPLANVPIGYKISGSYLPLGSGITDPNGEINQLIDGLHGNVFVRALINGTYSSQKLVSTAQSYVEFSTVLATLRLISSQERHLALRILPCEQLGLQV